MAPYAASPHHQLKLCERRKDILGIYRFRRCPSSRAPGQISGWPRYGLIRYTTLRTDHKGYEQVMADSVAEAMVVTLKASGVRRVYTKFLVTRSMGSPMRYMGTARLCPMPSMNQWVRVRCQQRSRVRLLVHQHLRKLQLSAASQGGDLALIPSNTDTTASTVHAGGRS